ncbi:hypothetical protein HMPREF0970_00532 [Schaalia odontolytica F0309]|uniref:Uncharacterized protein n=1 Tax=Schaalia odontolytica F0309 TaxID=649742 RepID=D4TX75_9ACTO|nr:hypothetical protein HMPREF0970_00532 [Schaalia odontolytica F0309]
MLYDRAIVSATKSALAESLNAPFGARCFMTKPSDRFACYIKRAS